MLDENYLTDHTQRETDLLPAFNLSPFEHWSPFVIPLKTESFKYIHRQIIQCYDPVFKCAFFEPDAAQVQSHSKTFQKAPQSTFILKDLSDQWDCTKVYTANHWTVPVLLQKRFNRLITEIFWRNAGMRANLAFCYFCWCCLFIFLTRQALCAFLGKSNACSLVYVVHERLCQITVGMLAWPNVCKH